MHEHLETHFTQEQTGVQERLLSSPKTDSIALNGFLPHQYFHQLFALAYSLI